MNPYEEELQKSIEGGQVPQGDEFDVKAYRDVFRALKQEPKTELSSAFADKVMILVEKKRRRDSSRDMVCLVGGIFLIFIAFIVAIVFTGFKFTPGFLSGIADYKWLFVFGVAFIIFLNWLDKRLIRDKHIV